MSLASNLTKLRGDSVIDSELGTGLNTLYMQYLRGSNLDTITAHSGGGQASAFQLGSEISRITTAAATSSPYDSVALPTSAGGLELVIVNHSANPIQVFGNNAEAALIDDVATATGVTQMGNSTVLYFCITAGNWYTEGLASGFARGYSLQTFSAISLAGNATITQGAGTPLSTMLVNVTGGAASAVTLPPSTVGMELTVHNVSAFNVSVFPNAGGTGTETINALSANAAYVMATNTSTVFTCTVAGQWFTVPRVAS
jgi:hypothetical protein